MVFIYCRRLVFLRLGLTDCILCILQRCCKYALALLHTAAFHCYIQHGGGQCVLNGAALMAAWVKGCNFQKHCGCTGLFFQGQAEIGFALGSVQEFLIQQAAQIRVEIILNRKRLINRAGIQRADLFQRFFRFRCAQVIRCFLQVFHKTRRRLAHHTFIADAAAHLQVCAVNIHNFFVFRQVAHHFALHFLPFTHAVGQLFFFLLAFILLH